MVRGGVGSVLRRGCWVSSVFFYLDMGGYDVCGVFWGEVRSVVVKVYDKGV